MTQYKACFCDGSCKKNPNGECGSGFYKYDIIDTISIKTSKSKAEEMREIAEESLKILNEKERNKAKEWLETNNIYTLIEDAAKESYFDLTIEKPESSDISFSQILSILKEDGFEAFKTYDGESIVIVWGMYPDDGI